MEFISKSDSETKEFAKSLAKSLKPGDILALYGDLGSGKTTFTKGLAEYFNIKKPITSPTFVLLKEYKINSKSQIQDPKFGQGFYFVHVDAYRMTDENDAKVIGLEEYLERNDVITVIEWPERIAEVLPKRTQKICFEYVDENFRKITVV